MDVEPDDSHPIRIRLSSAEAGLASSLIGSTVLILASIVAILATQLWAHADRSPATVLLHAWIARLAVGIPFLLIALGVWYGIDGLRNATRERRSHALSMVGLCLNVAAMGGWILASIALLNTTESMLSRSR